MHNFLQTLQSCSGIESSIKDFFLSDREAVIYGAGTQGEVLSSLCALMGKVVRCFMLSQGGYQRPQHRGYIPCFEIASMPENFPKGDVDVVIAVNARHNEEIRENLRLHSFPNVYFSENWDLQNILLNTFFYETFFGVYGAKMASCGEGRYVEYAMPDGKVWKNSYPENDWIMNANVLGCMNDIAFPSIFNAYGYLAEGPCEYGKVVLRENDVVFDLGASVGGFSTVAAAKNCMVYAFEPNPFAHEYLKRNLSLYPAAATSLCPYAIADKKGVAKFHAGDPGRNPASLMGGNLYSSADTAFEVECVSLDDFVDDNGISHVHFIKADIEGAERAMLKGAKEILSRFSPKLSLTTYHLPDDPQVMERLILEANPNYIIEHLWKKLCNRSHLL